MSQSIAKVPIRLEKERSDHQKVYWCKPRPQDTRLESNGKAQKRLPKAMSSEQCSSEVSQAAGRLGGSGET